MIFRRFFKREEEPEYIEVDLSQEVKKEKVLIKPFVLRSFDDTTEILNSLREGYCIAVIDIKPLKTKDIMDLKRAISKIKKTVEALNGDIAGFGENIIIATPGFAEIYRPRKKKEEKIEEIE